MNIFIGTTCGRLITINIHEDINKYDQISTSKLCANSTGPIIKDEKGNLIIGFEKKFLKIFKIKNKNFFELINCPNDFFSGICCIYNPNLLIFLAIKNHIYVWEKKIYRIGKFVYKINSRNKINLMSSILKSNLIVTSHTGSCDLNIWNILKNKLLFCGKSNLKEKISGIEGSPFSHHFIIQSIKGYIKIFTNTGICLRNFYNKPILKQECPTLDEAPMKFWDENTFLTGGSRKNLSLWDIRIGKIVKEWQGHGRNLKFIDCIKTTESFNRSFVVSSDFSNIIKLWDLRSSKELGSFKLGSLKLNSLKIV